MTTCRVRDCGAKTTLYLCNDCQQELHENLTNLAHGGKVTETIQAGRTASGRPWRIERDRYHTGLLQHLTDHATGQTRLGTTSGARGGHDENPIRFNTRASRLAAEIRSELQNWTTRLTDTTGTRYAPLDPHDTAAHALWLAHHTHQLANIDTASQLLETLKRYADQIDTLINRPTPPRFCGVCTTTIEGAQCGIALYAPRERTEHGRRVPVTEVTCPNPKCQTTHNIEHLWNATLAVADHMRFNRETLIGNQRTNTADRYTTGIMGELGEFIHWRVFHRWTTEGHLRPAGYLRPDGRRGITRHSEHDVPEYRLTDVRKTRRTMAERQRAGKPKSKAG